MLGTQVEGASEITRTCYIISYSDFYWYTAAFTRHQPFADAHTIRSPRRLPHQLPNLSTSRILETPVNISSESLAPPHNTTQRIPHPRSTSLTLSSYHLPPTSAIHVASQTPRIIFSSLSSLSFLLHSPCTHRQHFIA